MRNIIIHDVGLRDGLQMEGEIMPTDSKVRWANDLIDAGIKYIQLGSFVNPKKVYQMSDTEDIFDEILPNKPEDVVLSALVLNEKGIERGMKCGTEMFCMGVSASETHSIKNTGMPTSEALDRICGMAKDVIADGKMVQASVQSAFGCGFEGKVSEDIVFNLIEKYYRAGVKNISLADTAGYANPIKVKNMFHEIKQRYPDVELAVHFHDTYGLGLANVYSAYESGVKYIETSFGGLGGCPFTKSPSGNVATEDVVHMFQQGGELMEIDLNKLIGITKYLSGFLIRELPGQIYKNGGIKI